MCNVPAVTEDFGTPLYTARNVCTYSDAMTQKPPGTTAGIACALMVGTPVTTSETVLAGRPVSPPKPAGNARCQRIAVKSTPILAH
jgi:hypothetical protein